MGFRPCSRRGGWMGNCARNPPRKNRIHPINLTYIIEESLLAAPSPQTIRHERLPERDISQPHLAEERDRIIWQKRTFIAFLELFVPADVQPQLFSSIAYFVWLNLRLSIELGRNRGLDQILFVSAVELEKEFLGVRPDLGGRASWDHFLYFGPVLPILLKSYLRVCVPCRKSWCSEGLHLPFSGLVSWNISSIIYYRIGEDTDFQFKIFHLSPCKALFLHYSSKYQMYQLHWLDGLERNHCSLLSSLSNTRPFIPRERLSNESIPLFSHAPDHPFKVTSVLIPRWGTKHHQVL